MADRGGFRDFNKEAQDEIFDALADPDMSDEQRNLIFEYLIGYFVNNRFK